MNTTSSTHRSGLLRRVAVASSLVVATAAAVAPAAAATSATAQITANWEAFFSPKTSIPQKVALLQNGAEFAPVIRSMKALMSSVSAKVAKVTVHDKTSATVRYTIDEGGQPVLKNQTGTAVFQAKKWKVGDGSFCALLKLAGAKVKACPKGA